ncbi:hypothetical protein EZS27_026279, partial [termite gut metagenome]
MRVILTTIFFITLCPKMKVNVCYNDNTQMSKKFAEHSGLDLAQINKEVLKEWAENDVFAKSTTERDGCPS